MVIRSQKRVEVDQSLSAEHNTKYRRIVGNIVQRTKSVGSAADSG